MRRQLFCNLLRSIGRVPEEDLEEIRKTKKEEERHYIRLSGGGNDGMEEGLPDEYFEDDDEAKIQADLEKVREEQVREERKHEQFQNFCFFSFLFFSISAIIGLLALVGKLVHYLFLKNFVKDLDW